jgi:hypothetical protein
LSAKIWLTHPFSEANVPTNIEGNAESSVDRGLDEEIVPVDGIGLDEELVQVNFRAPRFAVDDFKLMAERSGLSLSMWISDQLQHAMLADRAELRRTIEDAEQRAREQAEALARRLEHLDRESDRSPSQNSSQGTKLAQSTRSSRARQPQRARVG